MAELNYGANLGRTCKFCLNDFVRPIAEITVRVDSSKEIRASVPITILEDRLINYVDTLMKRCDCRGDSIVAVHLGWYLYNPKPLVLQAFEAGLLSFEAKLY